MTPLSLLHRAFGRARTLQWLLSMYPPWLGAGIRVTHLSDDFTEAEVAMTLRWWNRNYVGTHFGGSLYSMIDPVYMLLLLENLPGIIVWDKASSFRFVRPGTGTVRARFQLPADLLGDIRARFEAGETHFDLTLPVQVIDESGRTVLTADKVVHLRTRAWDRERRARRSTA